jgi:hypothetical protein
MSNGASEQEYDFTLVLTGFDKLTAKVADALLAAGCDDGTIAMRSGRPYITFSRRAQSMKDAILTAIEDVRNAGVGADVLRVDYCNLVTQADIARRIGRSRQLVYQYMTGQRGPGAFPPPVCGITDKVLLWQWCEVAHWFWQNNMVKESVLREAEEVETINNVLELSRRKAENPSLAQEIIDVVSPHICK